LTTTPIGAAADAILRTRGHNLADWLADRVDEGKSSALIAQELEQATDGIVKVSREWIRRHTQTMREVA
jgi:hypothetical protein